MAWNGTGVSWRLVAIAIFAIACDDDGGLKSGVAGDKALEDLSSKEIEKICDAANDFIDAALPPSLLAKAACSQQALMTGSLEQCRAATQQCLDALADGGTGNGIGLGSLTNQLGDLQCFTSAELSSCEATVAELEGCLENTFVAQSLVLHAVSCEALAGEPTRSGSVDTSSSPLCQALSQKCPGIANFSRRPVTNPPVTNPPGTDPPGTDPPPTGSSDCADLELGYDGTDCATTGCRSNAPCICNGSMRSFSACNSVQGCLSSLDCDAACSFLGSVNACAQQNTCQSDSDCGDFYCVMTSSLRGSCGRGRPGDSCVEDQDCAGGDCGSDPRSSTQRCVGEASAGSTCKSDYDCASGICVTRSSLGVSVQECSDGASGDPCAESSECQSGACVYTGSSSGSMCSDRSNGSPCSSDGDCTSSHCAQSGTTSMCVAGDPGDACDANSDCTSGRCLTARVSGQRTCAYQPGQTCPLGVADCNGECRAMQASCSSEDCTPICGFGSCDTATLATWNPADKSTNLTLSNGNLTASASSSQVAVRATIGGSTGRWYWEVKGDSLSSSYAAVGVLTMTALLDYGLGSSSIAPGVGYRPNGTLSSSTGSSVMACSFASGTVIGVAIDLDSRVIYFSVNGVWQSAGDPAMGTGGVALPSSGGTVFPAVSLGFGDTLTVNFGQSAFAHAPPSGFTAVSQ